MGRHLIERVARGIPLIRPGLAADLNLLLDGYDIPWVRVFTAIGGLIDQNCLPALAVCVSTSSVTRLERIARLLTEFVVAQPRVGLALLAGQDLFDRFIALAPASALESPATRGDCEPCAARAHPRPPILRRHWPQWRRPPPEVAYPQIGN